MWRCQSLPTPGVGSAAVGHMVTPEPFHAGWRTRCHETCGDVRTLPLQKVGLETRDTWRHQSPSLSGGGPGAMRHMATPEPSHTGRRVWNHGTRGDTGALSGRVACPMPHGTWRCQSSLAPGVGLEPQGHAVTAEPFPVGCRVWHCGTRIKSYARGYPVCMVATVASKPTSGEAVNP
jgi:hypothetical protein